jgi:GR25 family glycosyltransferase involved in LPS biosynthesis
MIDIDKYYMCHYSKLTDRKKYVENVVSKYNIDLHWIYEYDKEQLDEKELSEKFPYLFSDRYYGNGVKLSLPNISLAMKHYSVFLDVIKNDYKNVVVFEDDIVLVDDFDIKLKKYINQLPENYDLLWIGVCCNLHIPQTNPDINVYNNNIQGSRCTHAYVISNEACKKMIDFFSNIYQPIDWFFNAAIYNLSMNNYWAEPALSTQNENFDSTLEHYRG